MSISDETLMAYADGELDAAESAEIAAALAADPALQARLRPFTETRRLLVGMAGDDLSAPSAGDAALAAMIRAASGAKIESSAEKLAEALEIAPRVQAAGNRAALGGGIKAPVPANTNRKPWLAVAAAAACAVIAAGWFGLLPDGGAALAPAQVAALDALPSGESRDLGEGRALTMIASYQQDAFCREYEISGGDTAESVVACREGDGWAKRFSVLIERPETGGYTAASEGLAALDAVLAPLGEPLTPEAEAAALAK